ncbi:MAG: tetratricopeptide repeat protein [Patescibacteria group bacterium]
MTKYIFISLIILTAVYLEFGLLNIWSADVDYALGQNLQKANQPVQAFQTMQQAIQKLPGEPLFHDEQSQIASLLSVAAKNQKEATLSSQLTQIAIQESNLAVSSSPNNVTFWKSRTKIFYTLAQDDASYLTFALDAINRAVDLAPTDAKVNYFQGVLTSAFNQTDNAIKILEKTIALKPNYRDAYFQLAKLYLQKNDKPKAKETADFILRHIGPDDEAQKWLEENKL